MEIQVQKKGNYIKIMIIIEDYVHLFLNEGGCISNNSGIQILLNIFKRMSL